MSSARLFSAPAARRFCRGLILGILPLLAVGFFPASLRAQDNAPANGNAGDNGNADRRARRGNFTPEAMLANLRTQFGVTDDAEWSIISDRITAVMDLRRSAGGGGGGGFRGGDLTRQRNTGNPELDALRSAVADNMPDAEIKARLDRLRVVRKENEAKLDKARTDLQAVLTVKQEAMAVMMGLLP